MSEMSRNTPITDCSNCGHLCLGPRILPCCHLLCRKCLLQLLETETGETVCCPSCHSVVTLPDPTLSRQLLQFPTDVAMEQLVMEILAEWSGKRCHVPHDPSFSCPPSHVCLDCCEVFCESCSHVHRSSSVSKHHTLLPVKYVEFSSEQQPTFARRPERGDDSTLDNKQNQLQETVRAEAQLFHQAITTGDQVIDGMKRLLTERESVQRMLKTYKHHLVCDDYVRLNDVILRRFRHVGKECLSAAEADMEHLHQMLHKEKINTPRSVPQRRETGQEGRHSDLTWTRGQMVVWVAVPVLCSLLLLLLLAVVIRPSSDAAVPYTADHVVMQPLCGDHNCSHYDAKVNDMMVTVDRRLVLASVSQRSLVVQGSSGSQTVSLGCQPYRVTQLHSGPIAVTCPLSDTVLLVNLGSSDPQIQRIKTKKWYWAVTAHPVRDALIVATVGPKPTVDVITLQGDVLQTLVDNRHKIPGDISTLSVVGEYLLMACSGSRQIYWIHHSDPRQTAEAFGSEFPKKPGDIAVDKAGNVFVVLEDGAVLVKDTAGQYRTLLAGKSDGKTYWMYSIAVHDNRLLVAKVTDSPLNTVVTEYLLVDQ